MIPFRARNARRRDLAMGLIAVNVLFYGLDFILKMMGFDLFMHMSKINPLIATGEFWRLFTATFAHLDFLHLLSNMWGIWIFWNINLRFYGNRKLLVIYLISGIGGSLLSYAFSPAISLGASGCLYGLFGANLYLLRRNPQAYRNIFSGDILIILGINLFLSFTNSNIDLAGHLGGLVTGYFLAACVGVYGERPFTRNRVLMQISLGAVLSVLLVASTLRLLTPRTYFEAVQYKLILKDIPGAISKVEQGIKKFPDSEELILVRDQLYRLLP
ncbi:MAG: rhomboid family intramembrane serine protease [Bacillota bacterium]|nr:rhomboid family intramembrane serine protease [Bacillota bacterium]